MRDDNMSADRRAFRGIRNALGLSLLLWALALGAFWLFVP